MPVHLVRRACAAIFFVSSVLSGLTLATFMLLAVLVFQGKVDTKLLFPIAVRAHTCGFAFLPVLILTGSGLAALHKRARIPVRITSKYAWAVVWVIWFAVFLHVFLTPVRYVHPEGNVWISTGRAGPSPVSEQMARRYLWSEMEWSFLIIFGGTSLLALASGSVGDQARSLESTASGRRTNAEPDAPKT